MSTSTNFISALVMGAGLLSAPFVQAQALAPPANGCRFAKISDLPATYEAQGLRPIVEVTINGKPTRFLVDTGSWRTSLFRDALPALGLSMTSINGKVTGAGGERQLGLAQVAEVGIGDMKTRNVSMLVIDAYRTRTIEFAGILGRDVLGLYEIEFDLKGQAIRLFKAENCPRTQSLAYWTQEPEIDDMIHAERADAFEVDVSLNGRPVRAILDSGSPTTMVTNQGADIAGVDPAAYVHTGVQVGGIGAATTEVNYAPFASVKVGDEEIKKTHLRVADLFSAVREAYTGTRVRTRAVNVPEMLLGADFLRSHRVLIAPSQNRIYFTYTGGPPFAKAPHIVVEPAKP